jgi:hypothetical protein
LPGSAADLAMVLPVGPRLRANAYSISVRALH